MSDDQVQHHPPKGDQEGIGEDSRVDDWFGQSVERDAELADELTDQLGPDAAAAEFDKQATGQQEQEARHGETIDPDQGRSAYIEDA